MIDSTGLAARRPPDQRPPGATTAAEWSVAAMRGAPGVPSTRSRQQHERRRAADLDIRTLHGRQAPPPGRQPTTRRQSRSHSGPLRAFQTRRCTSAYPPENPKSARQRRFPAPLAPPGPPRRRPAWTQSKAPRAVVELLLRADYRSFPQGRRSSSRQQRQHEHRSAADLGIRTPPRPSGTTARPSADHSASESASQRPPEGLPNPPVHLRAPPRNP